MDITSSDNINYALGGISENLRIKKTAHHQIMLSIMKKRKQCNELKEETAHILQRKSDLALQLIHLKQMARLSQRVKTKSYSVGNQLHDDQTFIKSSIVMHKMAAFKQRNKEAKMIRLCEVYRKQLMDQLENLSGVSEINKLKSSLSDLKKLNEAKLAALESSKEEYGTLTKEKKSSLIAFANEYIEGKRLFEENKKNGQMKNEIAQLEQTLAALKVEAESKMISNVKFFSDVEFKEFEDIQSVQPESVASPEPQVPGYIYDEAPPSCLSLDLSHDRPIPSNEEFTLPNSTSYTQSTANYCSTRLPAIPSGKQATSVPMSSQTPSGNHQSPMAVDAEDIINEPPVLENQDEYNYSVSDYDAQLYAKSPVPSDSGESTSGPAVTAAASPNFFIRKEPSEPKDAGGMFFNFGDSSQKISNSIFNLF